MARNVAPEEATSAGTVGSTRPQGRRWWLISRCADSRREVLTTRCGAVTLSVFSFEEEAGLFLELKGLTPDGWRAWEIRAGEITSVLCDPCVRVAQVALDPLPESVADRVAMQPTSMDRKAFLNYLLEGEKAAV